ncbi:MAG TPA: BamA/TamA family outer membrane protein [Flavilitoribacter sp.]|nr:BamA/TamA family outer membrane protein [Flavilitoribacter sp.]HMQ88561.1 BamA/TamA family outer membrane protein [Flavilitoribacter sp.]
MFLPRLTIGVLLLLLLPPVAGSQKAYSLQVLPLDRSPEWLENEAKIETGFRDSVSLVSQLQSAVFQLQARSWLEASVDTLFWTDKKAVAFLHVGPAYTWSALDPSGVPPGFLNRVGFREKNYRANQAFSYKRLVKLRESLLLYAENNGYPFARIWLDSLRFQGGALGAKLHLDQGPLVSFSGIDLIREQPVSTGFLTRYLGIEAGNLYDRSAVIRARKRLRELPYIKLEADPKVAFNRDEATLKLDLSRQKASRFDFLIGVLPNSDQSGKLLVTGSFKGEWRNAFQRGERIYAAFEQLRPQTQSLRLEMNYPYLLDLPFGLEGNFSLYKRDTSYIDLGYKLGVSYLSGGEDFIQAFAENFRTNLLNVDTAAIVRTGSLPDTLDVNRSFFGLAAAVQRLDYRNNPRKGFAFALKAGAGTKKILRNNLITGLPIEDPYAGLPEKSFQYRIEAQAEAFLPVFSRSTVKTGVQSGFLLAKEPILVNEQFRIGGARLLRGFDEEFIFASRFAVFTLEYRLLLAQNSYLFTFFDQAWVNAQTASTPPGTDPDDYPQGFGAGFSFETKAGIFGISLAFGHRTGEPLDLGSPKVHFGYLSLF